VNHTLPTIEQITAHVVGNTPQTAHIVGNTPQSAQHNKTESANQCPTFDSKPAPRFSLDFLCGTSKATQLPPPMTHQPVMAQHCSETAHQVSLRKQATRTTRSRWHSMPRVNGAMEQDNDWSSCRWKEPVAQSIPPTAISKQWQTIKESDRADPPGGWQESTAPILHCEKQGLTAQTTARIDGQGAHRSQ